MCARARSRDNPGVAANQVVARRIVRGRKRTPVVPEEQATERYGGAERRLAGQMSTDTPRPPHETAREYASTGSTARLCGIRMS